MEKEPIPVAKMMMNVLFLLFPVAFIWYVSNEIVVAVAITVLLGGYFSIEYQKRESLLFILGIVVGLIIELIIGNSIRINYVEDNIFVLPIWMPVFWGYIFIFIRRMGNLLVGCKSEE